MPKSEQKAGWAGEGCACAVLAALLAYFLKVSWRRWPDPIIDSGPQWYAAWRIAGGGMLFHETAWNYGPLSAYFNGWLFRILGANLSMLFAANLLIYGGILALAYAAFRRGWGGVGAFAACAVFISVFSFSHLTSVGNYNYAAPYAHETTHGMLLILLTLFAAAAWQEKQSARLAFALGTCGGLAAVLKPEFMLAAGVLGMAALALRAAQKIPVSRREIALLAAGAVWPTLAFTLAFENSEPWAAAFAHAGNAWWRVVVHPIAYEGFAAGQLHYAGLDHLWDNGWVELKAGVGAMIVMAALWAAGWLMDRPASAARIVTVVVLGALALRVRFEGGWFHAGQCLPLLTVVALVFYGIRLRGQQLRTARMEPGAIMRWLLAALAAAMLARMALFARVYHFGFFQAALAGMTVAAILAAEIPPLTGAGRAGRLAATAGGLILLTLVCGEIAVKSNAIRAEQTQTVGAGANQFYVFNREVDPTGALVDWVVKRLSAASPAATLLVLPEGLSINFLTRHVSPLPAEWASGTEETMVDLLRKAPPDYVALISLNESERGIRKYGGEGNPGRLLLQWVKENYVEDTAPWGEPFSGARLGASVLRRKALSTKAQDGRSAADALALARKGWLR